MIKNSQVSTNEFVISVTNMSELCIQCEKPVISGNSVYNVNLDVGSEEFAELGFPKMCIARLFAKNVFRLN